MEAHTSVFASAEGATCTAAASAPRARLRPVSKDPVARPPLATLSDETLIGRVAAGDDLALGELYDRFGGVAYGLALRILRDPGLAEDAVQEAFLSIWRSAHRFDRRLGAPRSWLLTLVHRRAVDLVQSTARRPEHSTEALPETPVASTAETAAVRAERRRVQAALESIPEQQRQLLELAYYGGYSQSQIAERLSLPLGTVKHRMFDGLAHLRKLLVEGDEPPPPLNGTDAQ